MGREQRISLTQGERNKKYNKTKYKQRVNRTICKGDMTELNGRVFKIHSEQRKKGQFDDTLDTLKIYVSSKYVKYIQYLTPIFVDLS